MINKAASATSKSSIYDTAALPLSRLLAST